MTTDEQDTSGHDAAIPLVPAAASALHGREPILGTDADVIDFWRFALSDLRMNNTRGWLAEFLVSRAVRSSLPRIEWAEFDVLWGTTRIEVKSAAYLQAWPQRALSKIVFTGLRSRVWDAQGLGTDVSLHADIYVFAMQTSVDHADYDPLDAGLWRFWAVGRDALEGWGVSSVSGSTLQRRCGDPVAYDRLGAELERIRAATADGVLS